MVSLGMLIMNPVKVNTAVKLCLKNCIVKKLLKVDKA